jgi:hypothetical protein
MSYLLILFSLYGGLVFQQLRLGGGPLLHNLHRRKRG